MRKQKLIKVAGYAAFGGVSLLLFFYFTFPAEAVGLRLVQEVQNMTGGDVTVSFDHVSLHRLSGISAEGVKIRKANDTGEVLELEVDEVTARLQLLSLLLFKVSTRVDVEIGEGGISALVTKTDDAVEIDLEIDAFDLAAVPALSKMAGLPLRGEIAGDLTVSVGFGSQGKGKTPLANQNQIAPERSEGEGKIEVKGLSFGPGAVAGFTIPTAVSLGEIAIGLEMKRGRAELTSLEQSGGDLSLQGTGSVNLRQSLRMSNLDTCLKLKVDESFSKKHPKLDSALQLAQVRFKKDGNGFINIKLGGKLTSPKPQRGLCQAERPKRERD
ncbi:MAG: type II secretion system protein GspN [Deltaproteobacteria bacterium RIFOXYB12_FULL_58_9]|nr:MAG: type II secretion system protein GspN [Deltaproteobacteria bacterium RIFOXYB12_FULL_58_9]